MSRILLRSLFAACFFCLALAAGAADPAKVLRIAQFDIDTLDPQQYADDPSFQVIMAIFEPMYEWDYLSPTPKLSPLTAAGPPEITDGGRVWTLRVKRGSRQEDREVRFRRPDRPIDLSDLGGRARLEKLGFPVLALCQFPGH